MCPKKDMYMNIRNRIIHLLVKTGNNPNVYQLTKTKRGIVTPQKKIIQQ